MDLQRSSVYHRPGRFAGWPANYGLWNWGEEVVSVFVSGWLGPLRGVHARDLSRPFAPVQMRSLDGGRTWQEEAFSGRIPAGRTSLSADEHLERSLQTEPVLTAADFVGLDTMIDFTDPETVVMCARTGLAAGSWSWFYVSRTRGREWSGPHLFPDFGTGGISARTDIVPLGRDSALFLLTVPKSDHTEGRVLAVRTDDGGRTFGRAGWVGDEPSGWMIMPSSVSIPGGAILTSVRCSGPDPDSDGRRHWIEVYRSDDEGEFWHRLGTAVPDAGPAGNPPALVALPDGRLVLSYGQRSQPCGLQAVISEDSGQSWSEPRVLTDDCVMGDMGYPRSVVIGGSVLTVFYANQGPETDRYIEAVRWTP